MTEKNKDEYSEQEAKRRFEQALRGARKAGHKTMKEVVRQRKKKQPPCGPQKQSPDKD